MYITGIEDTALAERYLAIAWEAIAYVAERYGDRVYLGVGLPYNSALISLEEVELFGRRLAAIDSELQLCVLDHFPTFRRQELEWSHPTEMLAVKRLLERTGLKTVVVQTAVGHFGPFSGYPNLTSRV